MTKEQIRAMLSADNDQDRAALREWWENSSTSDKMQVFSRMVRRYRNPDMETMSQFALLQFLECIEKYGMEET